MDFTVAPAMIPRSVKHMDSIVRRGDIFYADLSPVVGSEQGGTRPVLIVQNDTGNRHSPTVIAAAITSQTGKARLPTHINIAGGSVGLSKDSAYGSIWGILATSKWLWSMMRSLSALD